jgi:tripartite ATP-independent transporter DctP family solute receptor
MRQAAIVTALGAVMLMSTAAWAETLRIAGNFNSEHSSSVAIQQFKAEVEEASGGALTIETFPDMALGGAGENVSQTRAGTIAMTWVGMAYLSRTVPELEAVSLPFLFPSRQVAYEVIDGEVGDLLAEKLADKGFTLLGMMELGQRQVTNNVRPILTAEDLQGLKIRLQPIESHLATFQALGANPTPMDIKEVYSAMQQGVIDGHENPYNLIYASRFFEVQKYLSNTGHFFDFISVIANKDVFEGLSPEHQAIIRTAMDNAVASQRVAAEAADIAALATLQELGMQYDELPPEEIARIREITAPVIDQIRDRAGKDLVDSVIAAVAAASGS